MHRKRIVSVVLLFVVIAGCAGLERALAPGIERGRSLVKSMGCNDCHTPSYEERGLAIPEQDWLTGGTLGFLGPEGTSYPANLRLLCDRISEDDWLVLTRQMRKDAPMGAILLPKTPEADLRAIYRFVKQLGPKGDPAPASLPAGVTPTTRYIEYPYLH
jgi:hypothetical protein